MKIGSDRFWKTMGGIIGIVALLVLLMAANYIAGRTRMRHDFTQDKLYSLSDGSRAIVKKLDQKVTLKLFFNSSSSEVPQNLKDYAREVEDLLREYALASDGKIVVEKYDPQPDSDAEEWAQRYGIQGSPVQMFGPPFYFGLVCSCGGTDGALPTLDPRAEPMLEYNITRLIYRVTHPEKPVLGVLSSLPVMAGNISMMMRQQQQPEPWVAFRELRDDYVLKSIPSSVEEISPEVRALIIVHPKNLSDKALYAIDQFMLRGGKVLAFLDPFSIAEADMGGGGQQNSMAKNSSNMSKLLFAWGVSYDEDKVLADPKASTTLQMADNQAEDSLVFLSFGTNNLSQKDIITAQIGHLMLPFAGTFSCSGGGGLTVTPLITSSDKAGTVGSISARFGAQAVLSSFVSSGMKQDVAIRLAGTFKTAFPNGKPKDPNSTNSTARAESPGLTNGVSTVILVGDADMLYDRFCVEQMNFMGQTGYRPLNDNINFFMNAVEQIAGSQDLVGIRCRGKFDRSFDRVMALQQKAVQQWQEKEAELEKKLRDTQQQISQMEATKDKSQKFVLSEEQKQAIADFKANETEIKKQLKTVRKNLRGDIERLGVKVKVLNIALMPAIVILAGIAYWFYRKNRK